MILYLPSTVPESHENAISSLLLSCGHKPAQTVLFDYGAIYTAQHGGETSSNGGEMRETQVERGLVGTTSATDVLRNIDSHFT